MAKCAYGIFYHTRLECFIFLTHVQGVQKKYKICFFSKKSNCKSMFWLDTYFDSIHLSGSSEFFIFETGSVNSNRLSKIGKNQSYKNVFQIKVGEL